MSVSSGNTEQVVVPGTSGLLLELVAPRGDLGTVLLQRGDGLEERALLLLQSADCGISVSRLLKEMM